MPFPGQDPILLFDLIPEGTRVKLRPVAPGKLKEKLHRVFTLDNYLPELFLPVLIYNPVGRLQVPPREMPDKIIKDLFIGFAPKFKDLFFFPILWYYPVADKQAPAA